MIRDKLLSSIYMHYNAHETYLYTIYTSNVHNTFFPSSHSKFENVNIIFLCAIYFSYCSWNVNILYISIYNIYVYRYGMLNVRLSTVNVLYWRDSGTKKLTFGFHIWHNIIDLKSIAFQIMFSICMRRMTKNKIAPPRAIHFTGILDICSGKGNDFICDVKLV